MRRTADATEVPGERGAVLVLMSLLLVALMSISALVVDLGIIRSLRRSNQNLADYAALAAGEPLGDDTGPQPREGCRAAVRYLQLNTSDLAALSLPCEVLPEPCSALTPPSTVTGGSNGYEVAITYPVPDATVADDRVSGGLRLDDGTQCERLRVEVDRTQESVFATIFGVSEHRVSASAVVRQVAVQNRRVPSLWLLDPYGCNALTVQGGADVTVGTSTNGGLVSLDSDGSACSGSSYTVDVSGTGSRLRAIPSNTDPPGMISLTAMSRNQATCSGGNAYACDPSDVANGTLSPQPVRRPFRATRAPVDHAYNCKPSYPAYLGIAVQACDHSTPAYIDQLRAAIGTSGVPAGFNRWGTPGHSCNPSGSFTMTGNWVVECSDFRIGNGTSVTFNGNVIFNGSISLTGSGSLAVNTANTSTVAPGCEAAVTGCLTSSSASGAWVYMRNGDLRLNGGSVNLARTMLYQHNGNFTINGSAPPVWTAPSAGPFAGLAVWSERSSSFSINGGASMQLEGIFFTPFASPFSLSGGAPFLPQKAQFISYRATIGGGAVLTLAPNSVHAITIPAPPISLIR